MTSKGTSMTMSSEAGAAENFCAACKSMLGVEVLPEYRFHPIRKWRFDYALPAYKLAVEVEGGIWTRGRHVHPAGFLSDMEKYNAAACMGWRLLRVQPSALITEDCLRMVATACSLDFPSENASDDLGGLLHTAKRKKPKKRKKSQPRQLELFKTQ